MVGLTSIAAFGIRFLFLLLLTHPFRSSQSQHAVSKTGFMTEKTMLFSSSYVKATDHRPI